MNQDNLVKNSTVDLAWHDLINDNGVYIDMLNDKTRNQFYDNILKEVVPGKHCVDIGFGTGLLTFLALKFSPKFITAYEEDYERFLLGKHIVETLGYTDKVNLLNEKFTINKLDSNYDVLISETVGPKLWDQGVFNLFNTQVPLVPTQYLTNFCCCSLDSNQVEVLLNQKPTEFVLWYNDIKDPAWPDCKNLEQFLQLDDTIILETKINFNFDKRRAEFERESEKIMFDPGVEFESNFATLIDQLFDTFQVLENTLKKVSINPYDKIIDQIFNNSTILFTSAFDCQGTHTSTATSVIDHNFVEFEVFVDFGNEYTMIFPRHVLKYKTSELRLDQGHWRYEQPLSGIVIGKGSMNLKIRQNLQTGEIKFSK